MEGVCGEGWVDGDRGRRMKIIEASLMFNEVVDESIPSWFALWECIKRKDSWDELCRESSLIIGQVCKGLEER